MTESDFIVGEGGGVLLIESETEQGGFVGFYSDEVNLVLLIVVLME